MRSDLTVVYYTSNREVPSFEEKIRETLLDTIGGLPLISVSQKPIDFGKNICVGEREPTSQNAFRQLQIGVNAATTRFVCLAESDFLYPKEYFEFVPPTDDTGYLAMPVYVLFAQRRLSKVFVSKHRGCEGAMVVNRKTLADGIEEMLMDFGYWGGAHADGSTFRYLLKVIKRGYFGMSIPAISFKTDQNMHRKTPHDVASKTRELPYWGNSHELMRRYM